MAKQNRGRVRVLQTRKNLSRHGLRKGDGLSHVFSSFFFCYFFFKVQKVKVTLKDPPPVSRLRV
jgi:hypothetical protein